AETVPLAETNERLVVRLQRGDLRIVWESDGASYEPDFVAIEQGGTHWVVEAKADRDLETRPVRAKRFAAKRWAQHVSAQTGVDWRYLLGGEMDVRESRGSWTRSRSSERRKSARPDLAVPGGAIPDLALELHRLDRALDQLRQALQPRALGAELEQLLLELEPEVDARGELERQRRLLAARLVHLRLRDVHEPPERGDGAL